MKTKLSVIQTQKQVLAPTMQQSIVMLLLPITDLSLAIEQELQNNPLLELEESENTQALKKKDEELYANLERLSRSQTEPIHSEMYDEDLPEEKQLPSDLPLEDYLMRQLRLEFSDELKLKIGELIIGNIDEDGYLKTTPEEIASILGIADIALIEHILSVIHNFDPIGIASRDLKECLLTQLKLKNCNGELTTRIIKEHLEDLGKKHYLEVARKLEISLEEVKKIAQFISTLEPKPARNYRPVNANIYIKPDVFITYNENNGYQVRVNAEEVPQLRINPIYKNMLSRPNLKEEERVFIKEKLENALYFIKSIEQRGQTIKEITKYILERQKDFFSGNHLAIVPTTLKDVATAIDRNESTISRAINNKYVDTPRGLFPLKFFFSQAIATTENGNTSAQGIKEEIKEIIDEENKTAPLSDQDIQHHFKRNGVQLARRTVAKYREALRIPPSYLRKM